LFMLMNEPKSPFPMLDEKGKLSKKLHFDGGKKFPRVGWAIVPVDVVEAIPKIKHVYGKRVVYIPIWPYNNSGSAIMATDVYDRQMRLWKGTVLPLGRLEYLNGDPQNPQTPISGIVMSDLQTDHTTMQWFRQMINHGYGPEDISMTTLPKKGR